MNNVEYKNFTLKIENKVAIFMINRPDVRNAMSMDCWQELGHFIDEVSANDEIQVVIITGAGEKAFIAGADLKMLQTRKGIDALSGTAQGIVKKN